MKYRKLNLIELNIFNEHWGSLKLQEPKPQEPKPKNGSQEQTQTKQPEKTKEKDKHSERSSIQDKYPLNPDYLNQIVVLGKTRFFPPIAQLWNEV